MDWTEIKHFEKEMEKAPLPATAQLIWYKLMNLCNTLYWQEWFGIDNKRLAQICAVKKEDTIIKARQQLIDAGYIEFRGGTKAHPSKYRLIPYEERTMGPVPPYSPSELVKRDVGEQPAAPEKTQQRPLSTILVSLCYGNEDTASELHQYTAELFHKYRPRKRPTATDLRKVLLYIGEHREANGKKELYFPTKRKDMLEMAFERACVSDPKHWWAYIEGIYRKWSRAGAETPDQVDQYDDAWESMKAERESRNEP